MIHAKLIRNGDFSKTMEIDDLKQVINVPIPRYIKSTGVFDPNDLLGMTTIDVLSFYLDSVEKIGNITFATYREK